MLHKIGLTGGDVSRRIGAARLDPTFLMADVEIVATCNLFKVNRARLENLIHRKREEKPGDEIVVEHEVGDATIRITGTKSKLLRVLAGREAGPPRLAAGRSPEARAS